MTVRINKPALNLREELTKAQSVVPYVQQQFWMDGLVENGTFDSDTSGWSTSGTGVGTWAVDNGTIKCTGATSFSNYFFQEITCDIGKKYLVTVDVTDVSGVNTYLGVGVTKFDRSVAGVYNADDSVGTYTATWVATQSSYFIVCQASSGTSENLDNIQVLEIDENDEVIHSLPLGWKPLHVYEDGLIQREGDVHDYTVVKTGGAYAIKPAVQPTATTETCVIAEREL